MCPTTFTTHHIQAAIALLSACAVKGDQSEMGIYTPFGRDRASRLVCLFLSDLLLKQGISVNKAVTTKGRKNKKLKQTTTSTTATSTSAVNPTSGNVSLPEVKQATTSEKESSRKVSLSHALALRSATLKFVTTLEYTLLMRGGGGKGQDSLTKLLSSDDSSSEHLLDLLLSLLHSVQLKIEFARSGSGSNEVAPGFGLPFLRSYFGSSVAGSTTSTSNTASRKLPLRSASSRGAPASTQVASGHAPSSENTSLLSLSHAPVAALDATVLWLRGTVTRNYWARLPEEVYTLYTEVGGEMPTGVAELLSSFDDDRKQEDATRGGDHSSSIEAPIQPKTSSSSSSLKLDATKELELVAQAVSIATAPGQKRLRENLEKWQKERQDELIQKALVAASGSIVDDQALTTGNGSSATSTDDSSVHSHSQQRQQQQQLQHQPKQPQQPQQLGTGTTGLVARKGLNQPSLAIRAPSIQLMMQASSSFAGLDPLVADREKRKIDRQISDVLINQKKDNSVSTRNIVKAASGRKR